MMGTTTGKTALLCRRLEKWEIRKIGQLQISFWHISHLPFLYIKKWVHHSYNISEPATRPISSYSAYYAGWIRSRKGDSGYNSFRDLFNCCLRPPFFSPYFIFVVGVPGSDTSHVTSSRFIHIPCACNEYKWSLWLSHFIDGTDGFPAALHQQRGLIELCIESTIELKRKYIFHLRRRLPHRGLKAIARRSTTYRRRNPSEDTDSHTNIYIYVELRTKRETIPTKNRLEFLRAVVVFIYLLIYFPFGQQRWWALA